LVLSATRFVDAIGLLPMNMDQTPNADGYFPDEQLRLANLGGAQQGIQAERPEARLSPDEAEAFRLPPLPKKHSLPLVIAFRGAVFGAVCGYGMLLLAVLCGPLSTRHEFWQGVGLAAVFAAMCGMGGYLAGTVLEMHGLDR